MIFFKKIAMLRPTPISPDVTSQTSVAFLNISPNSIQFTPLHEIKLLATTSLDSNKETILKLLEINQIYFNKDSSTENLKIIFENLKKHIIETQEFIVDYNNNNFVDFAILSLFLTNSQQEVTHNLLNELESKLIENKQIFSNLRPKYRFLELYKNIISHNFSKSDVDELIELTPQNKTQITDEEIRQYEEIQNFKYGSSILENFDIFICSAHDQTIEDKLKIEGCIVLISNNIHWTLSANIKGEVYNIDPKDYIQTQEDNISCGLCTAILAGKIKNNDEELIKQIKSYTSDHSISRLSSSYSHSESTQLKLNNSHDKMLKDAASGNLHNIIENQELHMISMSSDNTYAFTYILAHGFKISTLHQNANREVYKFLELCRSNDLNNLLKLLLTENLEFISQLKLIIDHGTHETHQEIFNLLTKIEASIPNANNLELSNKTIESFNKIIQIISTEFFNLSKALLKDKEKYNENKSFYNTILTNFISFFDNIKQRLNSTIIEKTNLSIRNLNEKLQLSLISLIFNSRSRSSRNFSPQYSPKANEKESPSKKRKILPPNLEKEASKQNIKELAFVNYSPSRYLKLSNKDYNLLENFDEVTKNKIKEKKRQLAIIQHITTTKNRNKKLESFEDLINESNYLQNIDNKKCISDNLFNQNFEELLDEQLRMKKNIINNQNGKISNKSSLTKEEIDTGINYKTENEFIVSWNKKQQFEEFLTGHLKSNLLINCLEKLNSTNLNSDIFKVGKDNFLLLLKKETFKEFESFIKVELLVIESLKKLNSTISDLEFHEEIKKLIDLSENKKILKTLPMYQDIILSKITELPKVKENPIIMLSYIKSCLWPLKKEHGNDYETLELYAIKSFSYSKEIISIHFEDGQFSSFKDGDIVSDQSNIRFSPKFFSIKEESLNKITTVENIHMFTHSPFKKFSDFKKREINDKGPSNTQVIANPVNNTMSSTHLADIKDQIFCDSDENE